MKLLAMTIMVFTLLWSSTSTIYALDKKPGPKLAELLKKIDQATDPQHQADKITSQIFVFEVELPMAQIKFNNTTILKAPNKRKMITSIPNMMTETEVFDGKIGWKSNSRMGFQQLTGPALQFLKYTTISSNKIRFEDKFKKIELAKKTFTINDKQCYKLTCYPPTEYKLTPQIIYIDTKKYLTRRVEMVVVSAMGEVPSIANIIEYKKFAGFYLPSKMQMTQMGMNVQMTLISFKINQAIPDGEFAKPTNDKHSDKLLRKN
jgi:outer membrane lipoprotein-sorting protein